MKNPLWLFLLILGSTWPLVGLAADTVSTFQNLPGLADAGSLTAEAYVNVLYNLAISIAAILVVLRLIYAGVQYMFSEVVTSKGKAKEDIKNALLGLLIILGAVTILNTINPRITDTAILSRLATTTPVSRTSTPAPTYQQQVMKLEEAQERARQCGGTYKKITDGNFQVICPGTAPVTPLPGAHQLTGYPLEFDYYGEYVAGITQCQRAGGSPSEGVAPPGKFVLNCYR